VDPVTDRSRCALLERIDLAHRRRIPSTSVDRTLADLAAVLDEPALRSAVDRALRLDLTVPDRLARRVTVMARPGRAVPGGSGATRGADIVAEHAMTQRSSPIASARTISCSPDGRSSDSHGDRYATRRGW